MHGFGQVASKYEYELDGGGEAEDDLWRFKLGYQLNRFLAAEVHYGFNGFDSDAPDLHEGAVFGRFQLPYEGINVYALAGAGAVRGDSGEDETGPAVGLGIDFFGTERTALSMEYVQYRVGGDERDYQALTLGLKHHFNWPSLRSE